MYLDTHAGYIYGYIHPCQFINRSDFGKPQNAGGSYSPLRGRSCAHSLGGRCCRPARGPVSVLRPHEVSVTQRSGREGRSRESCDYYVVARRWFPVEAIPSFKWRLLRKVRSQGHANGVALLQKYFYRSFGFILLLLPSSASARGAPHYSIHRVRYIGYG